MFIATLQQLTDIATILVQHAANYTPSQKEWESNIKTQTTKISKNIPVAIIYSTQNKKAYGCIGYILSQQTTALQNNLNTTQQIDDYLMNLSLDLHMASIFLEFSIIPILLAATDKDGNSLMKSKNTEDAIFLISSKVAKVPAFAWHEALQRLQHAITLLPLLQEQQEYTKIVDTLAKSLQIRLQNYCTILESITHSLQQEKLQINRNLLLHFKNQPPEWMSGVHRNQKTGTIQHTPSCSCILCKCVMKKWNQHYT